MSFISKTRAHLTHSLVPPLVLILVGATLPSAPTNAEQNAQISGQHRVSEFLVKSATTECLPSDVRFFSLDPLTKEQREAGIRLFMSDKRLHIVERASDVDTKTCQDVLHHLQTLDAVTILEPAFSSRLPNPTLDAQIGPGCPNLDLDSEYRIDDSQPPDWWRGANPYTRDPPFLKQPRDRKQSSARAYVNATANFEYYDLSHYLGEGFWGYFAEGGRHYTVSYRTKNGVHYDKPPFLFHDAFCFPYFETIEKLVNVKTCQTASDPYSPLVRITNGAFGPVGQHALPNFFAFIDVDGKLYRFSLDAPYFYPADLAHVAHPAIEVFVDRIEQKDNKASVKQICTFSTFKHAPATYITPPGITPIDGE